MSALDKNIENSPNEYFTTRVCCSKISHRGHRDGFGSTGRSNSTQTFTDGLFLGVLRGKFLRLYLPPVSFNFLSIHYVSDATHFCLTL